jgi:hypothetical protein
MRRHFRSLAVLAPILLAACLEPEPIPELNYGLIGLQTVPSTTDTILSPEAIFLRTQLLSLPTSRLSADRCLFASYPNPPGSTQGRILGAGASVTVSTATSSKQLFPVVDATGETYRLSESDRFPFHPGEEVTITVPGEAGGFSGGTISVLTARGFTMGPIDPSPPPNEGLDLTWSPAGDDGTKMLISLQYSNDSEVVDPNRQIFCELLDDGAAEVPVPSEWRTATPGSRRFEAARWRVAAKEVPDGILFVVSVFEIEEDVVD